MEELFQPLVTLKLSIQQALLGEVTDRLHSVTCSIQDNLILIAAYYRDSITPEDIGRLQMIGSEVIAHFPDRFLIEERCLSLNETKEEMLQFWAYRRADT